MFNKIISEIKKPGNLILLSASSVLIIFLVIKSKADKKSVLANAVETEATIKGINGCYRNGKCIDFVYSYKGVKYKKDASVSLEFASWCKDRNFCRGKTFRLLLDSLNPENILVYWEEMYEQQRKRTD